MLRKKLLIVFLLVLVLGLLTGRANARDLPKVTGSGHVIGPDGALRVASVTAHMRADGSVTGQGQGVVMWDPTVVIHMEIDCMRLFDIEGKEGKGAVLSGWTTHQVNFPAGFPNPSYWTFLVFDAGEGKDSEDIFARGIGTPGPEFLNCQMEFPGPLIPLQMGNVQVHD